MAAREIAAWRAVMSFEEALEVVSRDDRFKATIYAMNTLLIEKGVYSREEFETLFVEWVRKEVAAEHRTPIPAYRS
jgi:hypothetical protein